MNQFPSLAFIGNSLDRCANHRTDKAWLQRELISPTTRHVHLHGDKVGAVGAVLQTHGEANSAEAVFLGRDESGAAWFASRADTADDLVDLRSLALAESLPPWQLGLLAQARSLLHWHERHGYCANCGHKTEFEDAGYRRHCKACLVDHFPRTDPVIIIAVRHRGRVLLGRQSSWPQGMYSTLAGFMEPGETIEQAARREVFEESGIRVGNIRIHTTQPWPFPSSLMIGLIGEALNDEITVDVKELETARWFERAEVQAMLKGNHKDGLKASNPMAIAYHLVSAAIQPF